MNFTNKKIRDNIRRKMNSSNVDAIALAESLELNIKYLSNLLDGKRAITEDLLFRVSKHLNVPMDSMILDNLLEGS